MNTAEQTLPAQTITEALRGPWQAVLAERTGWLIDPDDLVTYDPGDVKIQIVRGTAAPERRDGEMRLPGSYVCADKLAEFDDFEEPDEVEIRWVQAQAMAAGLNAAAKAAE